MSSKQQTTAAVVIMLRIYLCARYTCALTVLVTATVQGRVHELRGDSSQVQRRIDAQPDASSRPLCLFRPIIHRSRDKQAAFGQHKPFPVSVAVAEPHPHAELSQVTVTGKKEMKQAGLQLHLKKENRTASDKTSQTSL